MALRVSDWMHMSRRRRCILGALRRWLLLELFLCLATQIAVTSSGCHCCAFPACSLQDRKIVAGERRLAARLLIFRRHICVGILAAFRVLLAADGQSDNAHVPSRTACALTPCSRSWTTQTKMVRRLKLASEGAHTHASGPETPRRKLVS